MEHTKEMTLWMTNPEDYVMGMNPNVWLDGHGANMESQGWLRISEHEVTVQYDLPSRDEIRGKSVEQLRAMIRDVDAKAQRVKTELEGKIQNLLAIGHDAPEEEEVWERWGNEKASGL